jgi:hypothetical protein
MKKTIKLTGNEPISIDDLTITLDGGGHKILMGENGGRAGDRSFAYIILQTPRIAPKRIMIYPIRKGADTGNDFDMYHIICTQMEWNGKTVTLVITKKRSGVIDKILSHFSL